MTNEEITQEYQTFEKEIFRTIVGLEDYHIGSMGNIKSFKGVKVRFMKPCLNGRGYLTIRTSMSGEVKTRTIHQLVAMAFHNYIPPGNTSGLVVNHINNIKTDNRSVNLEVITNRENCNLKHIPHSSKYTGVSWCNHTKKWKAVITVNGGSKYLGVFIKELDASKAYQKELSKIKNP